MFSMTCRSKRLSSFLDFTNACSALVCLLGFAGIAAAQQTVLAQSSSLLPPTAPTSSSSSSSSSAIDPPPLAELPAAPGTAPARHGENRTLDVSLGVFAQLTASGTLQYPYSIASQGSDPSAGVRATLHQQFYRFLGYRIDLGYTRTAENYLGGGFVSTPNGFQPARGAIGTNVYETAVSYVIEAPEHRGRFTPFGDAGGALLTFLPTQSHQPDAVQVRPALGFGAGLNYRLSSHLGLRAEYRGLFYKNPDFKTSGFGDFVTTKNFTVTNEPTISLVYTFKSAKKGK